MVIEQYTIPIKYNFPQLGIDTVLPQRFLQQSLNSLRLAHNKAIASSQLIHQVTQPDQLIQTLRLRQEPLKLKPKTKETLIAATDSSTIKIGETATGILIAVRGATAWRQNRAYKYTRIGPFVFHITEDNKNNLLKTLEKSYFSTSYNNSYHISSNVIQTPIRLAGLLERWMQAMLAKTVNRGILLFDGSLTAGTIDTPVERLREILSCARQNQNVVLAFSKATTLRSNGVLITEQLPNGDTPYLLETMGLHAKPPQTLLGDVYVARLNKSNLAFRLDIDKELDDSAQFDAMERLVGNDCFMQSYPETLRLSHILCTFTANEVTAIKHFVTMKHGLQIVNRPDMHKILFGPFGSGEIWA